MATSLHDNPRRSSSDESLPQPLLVIEPRRSPWSGLLRELWHARELVGFLTWRDIKVRYKQTILGIGWALLQPLATMLAFVVFFGWLGKMNQGIDHYPLFVYTGVLPWTFFSVAVTQASSSVLNNGAMITKVYFPRLIIPAATVAVALVDFMVSNLVLAGMMIWYRVPLSLELLLIPVWVLGLAVAALGVGLWLSALTVMYRDLRYVVPLSLQIWMFACPIGYPLSAVPESWQLAYALNPVAGLIAGLRSSLLGEPFAIGPIAVSLAVTALLLLTGLTYFVRVERRLPDLV